MGSISYFTEKFKRVREQSEAICAPLEIEDYVVQPVVDVSPPKWHLGHTTWFFEKMLLEAFIENYKNFHPDFNYVFNSYYETVGKRVLRTNRGNLTRPSVDEVLRYRAYVDQQVLEFLDVATQLDEEVVKILEIGLQHEQQHQELLMYDIKYILGTNPLFPAYSNAPEENKKLESKALNFLKVESGNYRIGHAGDDFCYDNELGIHQVFLHDFEIGDRLVTNGEYLEFIESGGYKNFNFWYSEAWDWLKTEQRIAPKHWHLIEGQWHNYTLHGLKEINIHAPVSHVSQYEAAAYAMWKGMRLPTEFEWEVACNTHQATPPDSANFVENQNFKAMTPESSNFQFFGDLWEWTNSSYSPYPYFKTEEGALGEYNGKFMINQMVLRGGSYATPKDHIRPTYRNFFHPNLSWQFTGIRLAKHV
ncbi:MAG: ergothioneine biosynthesis protein EgtB [Reichenbachiella sp.]